MVSAITLENVRSIANIEEIVGGFVKLKKVGANLTGKCPFHNEKTSSFNVSPVRGIYKCFGCGKGGDVFSFVMEHEKKSFSEAIEWLADYYQVAVEYDGRMDKAEIEKKKSREKELTELLKFAEEWYHNRLLQESRDNEVWQWMYNRGITEEIAVRWRLGYAPDDFKNICNKIIDRGWYQPAIDIGLIKTKNGSSYDVYRNRLIIPHENSNGVLTGFIGRILSKEKPKYINPAESDIYIKSREFFGLSRAKAFIRESGFAYLAEGQIDVLMMHENTIMNTVGTGGTALTRDHILLLRKFTNHFVLVSDGDSAGENAMLKQIDELLKYDLRIEVVILPPGEDPDSYLRQYGAANQIQNQTQEI